MDLFAGVVFLAIPLAAVSLGASPSVLGNLGAVQRLAYIATGLASGRLSDRLGPRVIVLASSAVLTLIFYSISLSGDVGHLFILVPLVGMGTGMFWAPLQAWVGERHRGGNMLLRISRFNIAWSVGNLAGSMIAGALFSVGRDMPFIFASIGTLSISALIAGLPVKKGGGLTWAKAKGAGEPEATNGEPHGAATLESVSVTTLASTSAATLTGTSAATLTGMSADVRTLLSWASIFAAFFAVGVSNTLFPKMAAQEGIAPAMVGILLAGIAISRTITFFAMGQGKGLQHHRIPLPEAFLAGALGAAMIAALSGDIAYMAGFLLIGVAQGIGYTASLFYSLNGGGRTGRRTGIHEAMVSSGVMSGAFLGGIIAERFGMRPPYAVVASLMAAVAIVAWLVERPPTSPGWHPQLLCRRPQPARLRCHPPESTRLRCRRPEPARLL